MDRVKRPTYMSTNLALAQRDQVRELLSEFVDCFAWSYIEMPGLDRELVVHRLPIK
jgi:hypothetical protein